MTCVFNIVWIMTNSFTNNITIIHLRFSSKSIKNFKNVFWL